MAKYRKGKYGTIDAFQVSTGTALPDWLLEAGGSISSNGVTIQIDGVETEVSFGSWIIFNHCAALYSMTDENFQTIYAGALIEE